MGFETENNCWRRRPASISPAFRLYPCDQAVTGKVEKFLLTEVRAEGYAPNQDKRDLFINATTVLPTPFLVRDHPGVSLGLRGAAETGFWSKGPFNGKTAP